MISIEQIDALRDEIRDIKKMKKSELNLIQDALAVEYDDNKIQELDD
jgi:hypothetical protein